MKNRHTFNITLSMLIFGTVGIFVRFISFPAGFIAMSRGFIGVLFLLFFLLATRKRISFSDIKANLLILVLSGIFIGINWILLFESYNHTTVATATLCYYMAPVFVILASTLIFREKLSLKKGLCVLGAICGMILVSGIVEHGMPSLTEASGILLGLGAAVFYACVVLLNKRMKSISSFDMTVVQLFFAALTVMIYTLTCEKTVFGENAIVGILLLLFVGVVHTGIAYVLYFGSVKELPASKVAIFAYIDPIVAILLSFIILKEEMSLFSGVGAIIILMSTLISELDFQKPFRKK